MQEPAGGDVDMHLLGPLSQHEWQQHEVVVMHPDVIAVLEVRHDGICKGLVRFTVRKHGVVVEADLIELVVEQRPDRRICGHSISTKLNSRLGVVLT